MLITVTGIVDSTHPDSKNFTLSWSPTRRQRIMAIEAINRTTPCSVAVIIRDRGTVDNAQGCCLVSQTILGVGYGATWSNYDMEIDEHDEIAVIFQNCLTGDTCNVHIHIRGVEK